MRLAITQRVVVSETYPERRDALSRDWAKYIAEIFPEAQPMAAVGVGAEVGLHPSAVWNNPEPEGVLFVNSRGEAVGAALGNDVNLRDIEGRSALLLGKAKDNNGSCAIGPFIRVFDEAFTIDDVRGAEIGLVVEGDDGFRLAGASSMSEMSRDPLDIVAQMMGAHHPYPDVAGLLLGTMFGPVEDRGTPGDAASESWLTLRPGRKASSRTEPRRSWKPNWPRAAIPAPCWRTPRWTPSPPW